MNRQQSSKPVFLIRDELMNKIVTAINESGLSYFVLEYIFKDILNEIHIGAVRQAQAEQAEYKKATMTTTEPNGNGSTADISKG